MAEIQYERGGNDLPQGAATELNQQAAAIPQQAQSVPVPEVPLPDIGEEGPDYVPSNEREQLLFAPAEGKGRDMPLGPGQTNRVPVEVVRKLPALARAASKPDAPPSLVALYRMTLRALEDEMRTDGG